MSTQKEQINEARDGIIAAALELQAARIRAELHPDDPGWDAEYKEEALDSAISDLIVATVPSGDWTIEPHDPVMKSFTVVHGPTGTVLNVDYDDVDHALVDRTIVDLVERLNA